jgi:transposase
MSMSDRLFEQAAETARGGAGAPVCGGKRFLEVPARSQMSFETRCVEDFVPADAPVRVFDEIMSRLDYSAFERQYCGGGRPAWPPLLLAKLLLFGYSQGLRSARQLSRALESDLRLMWLAHEQRIGHQRLSEFRRQFVSELAELYRQTVRLAEELGLVDLELVAVDGSKVAASARRRAVDEDTLRRQIQRVLAEAERADAAEDDALGAARGDELPADVRDPRRRLEKLQRALEALRASGQKQVAVNDPEAPLQKTTAGLRPGYNVQFAVDKCQGIIVAQDVTAAQNDTEQLRGMLAQTIANTGAKPAATVTDTGYHSGDNLEAVAQLQVEAYIGQAPPPEGGDDERFTPADFEYDEAANAYLCPAGKRLTYRREHNREGTVQYLYATGHADCRECPWREHCLSPRGKRRELYVMPHAHLTRQMRQRLDSEAGQRAVWLRRQVVEPVFGTLKAVLGLRQFLLRGLEGARVEVTLAATAFNLRKLAAALA